ncbi:uncharacterized protein LOC115884694 isoform X1 [Sitophilus oryzae]|uniref:Uncharacterized protein LOC115884694 isoform X1 n=1 Tax=Sitophilus oryzae TaxID=7048 RepID=A0A6J2Y7W1_SITOR|nr:uncharacterized protein LOC115884694 isoform X1 [Sitophilus oryzae]
MSKLQVFLSLALLAATARGQATFCHFCNTERDGLPCEDPIDSSRIQVQRCADLAVASNLESFPALDGSANNAAQVCVTLSYTYFDRNVTIRGCDAAETIFYGAVFSACDYNNALYEGYIINFSCIACEGELCNAVTPAEIVEEVEDVEEVEEVEEEGAGEENEDEQQGDAGGSADVMSISARFIIITALALIML